MVQCNGDGEHYVAPLCMSILVPLLKHAIVWWSLWHFAQMFVVWRSSWIVRSNACTMSVLTLLQCLYGDRYDIAQMHVRLPLKHCSRVQYACVSVVMALLKCLYDVRCDIAQMLTVWCSLWHYSNACMMIVMTLLNMLVWWSLWHCSNACCMMIAVKLLKCLYDDRCDIAQTLVRCVRYDVPYTSSCVHGPLEY